MTDLAEFVLARIADEEGIDRAAFVGRALQDGVPLERAADLEAAWDRLFATACLRYTIAMRRLGVAILEGFRLRSVLRTMSMRWASHPDFRQEWRV